MKLTHSKETDAAYIYFEDDTNVRVKSTFPVDPEAGEIFLDFDEYGYLVGIEILDASNKLSKMLLDTAEDSNAIK